MPKVEFDDPGANRAMGSVGCRRSVPVTAISTRRHRTVSRQAGRADPGGDLSGAVFVKPLGKVPQMRVLPAREIGRGALTAPAIFLHSTRVAAAARFR
jgi:hypothetical protein